MLTLRGEKSALWNAWKRKDQTSYQCAVECRAIGIHWSNIKAIVTARRKAGEDITVQRWATQHAPVSVRWLNEYSDFASRWNEFIETLAMVAIHAVLAGAEGRSPYLPGLDAGEAAVRLRIAHSAGQLWRQRRADRVGDWELSSHVRFRNVQYGGDIDPDHPPDLRRCR